MLVLTMEFSRDTSSPEQAPGSSQRRHPYTARGVALGEGNSLKTEQRIAGRTERVSREIASKRSSVFDRTGRPRCRVASDQLGVASSNREGATP